MSRQAIELKCSEEDRKELERIRRSQTESRRRVDRAKIILGCLGEETNAMVAERLKMRANTVSKWRQRVAKLGMAGLDDIPRSGRPMVHIDLRTKVLKTLETAPPKGQAVWDGKAIAAAVGAKKSSVYAILQKNGIHLQRTRSWCVSTDPEFAAKAADIS